MSTHPASGLVVVGIDAAGSAENAVDWAAAEAAARRCRLRIVHALPPPLPADPHGLIPPLSLPAAQEAAEAQLRHAASRARRIDADLPVSTRLVPGNAAQVLLAQSREARLLVLGGRGRRGLRTLLAHAVSTRVIARASCPVAVVRARQTAGEPACSAPRVVVGVDGSATSTAVMDYGVRAARQRGVPLVAVHAWNVDPPADVECFPTGSDQAELVARRLLEEAVRPWTAAVPDVVGKLVCDEPGRALVTESRGAALLVVGAPRRRWLRGLVSGSTVRRVLRHDHSPTTVLVGIVGAVPDGPPSAGRGADRRRRRDPSPGGRTPRG